MSTASKLDIAEEIVSWQSFYQKYFGINLDLSQVKIPEHQPGFDRLLVIAQGLTPNKVFETCQEHFQCWRYTEDLDEANKNRNDREPIQTYAIWVRDQIEADEELRVLSVEGLKKLGILGVTLLERLIYEFKFWDETKQHLDILKWTLCSGSRYLSNYVPRVGWAEEWFVVRWSYPDDPRLGSRARAVVS